MRAGIERLGFSECYKEGRAHCRELYGSLVSVVGTGMIACWCSLRVIRVMLICIVSRDRNRIDLFREQRS